MRGRRSIAVISAGWAVLACLGLSGLAPAAVYDLYDGGNLYSVLPLLQPGDTVVLHSGTYGHVRIEDLHGSPEGWITFRGAAGEARPVLTCDPARNVIDLVNVSYLRFEYLYIKNGSDGIKFEYGSSAHDIWLEDLVITMGGNTCINASGIVEVYHLTVRNCDLSHSGVVTGGHGEGLYLGMHGAYYQPQVHDSLIEHNYIHDLGGSHGDGVEIKHGCYNVIAQDNVLSVHQVCPSFTLYGTYKNDPAYNNIIRRNLIWRPVDAGIQAAGETTIENNVIIGAMSRGLSIRNRDDDMKMQHMRIVNNTIYMADGDAAVSLYAWNSAWGGRDLVFANNAVFQDWADKIAIRAEIGLDQGTFAGNLVYGQVQSQLQPISVPGLTVAAPAEQQFISTSIYPGRMNFFPKAGSQLLDAGDPACLVADDFNLLNRPFGAAPDVGAYEVHNQAANPGWALTLGLKDMAAAILPGDINRDGAVDVVDLLTLVDSFGSAGGDPAFNPACDLTGDGSIDVADLLTMVDGWGRMN